MGAVHSMLTTLLQGGSDYSQLRQGELRHREAKELPMFIQRYMAKVGLEPMATLLFTSVPAFPQNPEVISVSKFELGASGWVSL